MSPFDLTGEARELYERWRGVGYSREAAMERVERSGLLGDTDLVESFRRLGLSESAARHAARGRDVDEGDELAVFRSLGLSEAEARSAAKGRGSSRPGWGRERGPNPFAGRPSAAESDPFGVRLLANMAATQRQLDELKQVQSDKTSRGQLR